MSTCIKYVAAGLLGGALTLAGNSAAAQSASNGASARAEALVTRARALLDAGNVAEACSKLEAAEALEIGIPTLLQLGDCYQRMGRTASAWHTFLEAEALAHDKKDREQSQAATERIALLEPRLNRIVFVVPMTSRVPGLTVRLGANTVPASEWGAPIPIDPGTLRVSASAKGYRPWTVDVDARAGEGRRYTINVPTLAPEQAAKTDRGRAYRTAGVVTGSVGLAGIGAGAMFSALSHNANDAACSKGATQCSSTPSSKSAYADAAAVSFALGGALVATGVTLFVLAPSPDKQERHALRVAARYANSGGRVQLEGVW